MTLSLFTLLIYPLNLRLSFELCCVGSTYPSNKPYYQVFIHRATISLLLLFTLHYWFILCKLLSNSRQKRLLGLSHQNYNMPVIPKKCHNFNSYDIFGILVYIVDVVSNNKNHFSIIPPRNVVGPIFMGNIIIIIQCSSNTTWKRII